jgi:hypothetical protein
MAHHWFALVAERPSDALAAAAAFGLDGAPAGFLAAWSSEHARRPGSRGIDVRAVDPDGEPAWVSLALAPPAVRMLFDDPAVSWALRRVLAGPSRAAVSTLTLDSTTIAGALTAVWGPSPAELADDPFACLFPARLLRVEAGFIGAMPAPIGPGIQRYAGAPWPWDRFA